MTYRFDLVADSGHFHFADRGWDKVRFILSEFQPARKVSLMGNPPSRIRVVAVGDGPVEIAPAVLARVEELAGTSLAVEPLTRGATLRQRLKRD
ncbi:hypothetical protein [Nocardioides sp. 503]|uniref:hypothetical protein n=1 Tax=Nocardioides sp. 503 TaxID=2508326 RepID=UPI00106F4492|nr:hypothetical protein [Nocardioides sp. 503]